MSESPEERRPKRSRRDTSYKAKAFEKFKQLKSGNRKKYEVEELESIYETVDEKEYIKQVLSRQDDDWIVDDDGSGYVEDGRDIFDDDLDSESIAKAQVKGKGVKRKKKDVSESAGKGNLHVMLSNMSSKKKEETKIDDDAMLSEILGELDESTPTTSSNSKSINSYSFTSRKLAAKNYMKNFSQPIQKQSKPVHSVLKEVQNSLTYEEESSESDLQIDKSVTIMTQESIIKLNDSKDQDETPKDDLTIETDVTQEFFDDDFDMTQIEEFESQDVQNTTVEESKLTDELQSEFMTEWESMSNEIHDFEADVPLDKTDVPLLDVDDKKIFRFYWWDAYEDPEKQKGVVFLFGKTYCAKTKHYVSCCVAVRNINRRLFLLPRPFELDADGKPTDEPVTFKKLYEEVNETILKPLHISSFRTRYVTKKYAFNPEVPTESDYLELRYPATDPKIDIDSLKQKPKTFSKIFGLNTSYLEILLLDRKIKGPCWLDVSNPVPVSNPVTWCKFEINCTRLLDLKITSTDKPLPPPPLVVMAINLRNFVNPKTYANEIVMLSCLTHMGYAVDKQAPNPPFQQHFCVFSCPTQQVLPLNIHEALKKYKATKVQKMDTERALLNYFITQFARIDPDLVVGHDLQGYQINILSERLSKQDNKNFSKLGRLRRFEKRRLERTLFVGRLVCDVKISAKELIKSRSYDLDTLCQNVLKLKENQRIELESEEIPKMYKTADDILKLISFTMQDTAYILKIMYDLNVIPLALQITNIAGNVMSKTLMGGRSERNEFLLLHAFSEKDYIVPDKEYRRKETNSASRKKPTYSGGLVLDPKVGFYDKLILLMDFNSLYPSIIQEYNICFTTLPISNSEENLVLPDRGLKPGILPTEIRKLVESRRQVKGLMNNPDISNDLRMQYNIRQMALKLTANSMYGCLGFSNSRFYAKNLAALVTHKGREILTNTRDLVQKMCYQVVYGDTDSIMINTNCLDYDQVFKIGLKIKQEVNKLYKQVELDIDGVFKYLLLLKKKKYAAVTLTKTKDGKLKMEKEYKGLDIVRRDWSQLACETGKYILDHILSDQSPDDRVNNIHTYLSKIKEDLEQNRVPIPLLVITKQLTKDPKMYTDKNALPHVQVALRYNQKSGGHLRAGDTVPYVICDDGSGKPATQRAYHVDELKNSEHLKVDVQYYLAQQIHPVVTRICEPIEGIDFFHIAESLGLDTTSFKRPKQVAESTEENSIKFEVKFRDVDKFKFICFGCKQENIVDSAFVGNVPFLEKCNTTECVTRPIDYLPYIQNQLALVVQRYITKYYENKLVCEDPACTNETTRMPLRFARKYPVCTMCQNGVMYRVYTEQQLYTQLTYFRHIFDLTKVTKKPLLEQHLESGYHALRETVEKYLNHSGYSVINLSELFSGFMIRNKQDKLLESGLELLREEIEEDDEDI